MAPERTTVDRRTTISRSLVKLLIASVLLNMLVFAAYVTSTPERSPAGTWMAAAYKLRFDLVPLDAEKDRAELVRMHNDSGKMPDPECIACHGTMLESEVAFHRIHLRNELLPGLRCADCHRRVDLRPRTNDLVVDWVDVSFCKKCHSPFPGLEAKGSMQPIDFEIDCTMCHSGSHAFRHEPSYLSQIISPKECKGCHGGRVLPWDPLHEQPDWMKRHGQEALKLGTNDCFSCHDFGMKFCDTCHKEKPPSHTPAERWKDAHRDASRADTRACYTCHKIDFCKRCHLSHEDGWKQEHPMRVRREGSHSCRRCHSESFCSYCHTVTASEPSLTETQAP